MLRACLGVIVERWIRLNSGGPTHMTIHLPDDLRAFLHDQVLAGRYRSEDEAIREAVDLLKKSQSAPAASPLHDPVLGSIGSMSDAADELDVIVADAMRNRREQPWRLGPDE